MFRNCLLDKVKKPNGKISRLFAGLQPAVPSKQRPQKATQVWWCRMFSECSSVLDVFLWNSEEWAPEKSSLLGGKVVSCEVLEHCLYISSMDISQAWQPTKCNFCPPETESWTQIQEGILESEVTGVEVNNWSVVIGSRTPEPVGVDIGASFLGPISTVVSSGPAAYTRSQCWKMRDF